MIKPKALILRTAGTNCDMETAHAFEICGARTELVHINQLVSRGKKLNDYQILAIPGGFTYGDDIASGKILANELRFKLKSDVIKFINDGKIVIGICNGFQVLVKSGFLPDIGGRCDSSEVTLSTNDSARFEDRWTYLRKVEGRTECIWTKGMDEVIYLPVAHGEGKFIPGSKAVFSRLKQNGQIVFQYVDRTGFAAGYPWNPNGSYENIAGICDRTGRIFGLMPHPERHLTSTNHPAWTRKEGVKREGDGLMIFRNGVAFITGS